MSTSKTTIYLGLNDKDTKKQKYDDKLSLDLVASLAQSQGIDCFTAIPCFGVYRHENGELVNEQTLKIEVIDTDIKEFVNLLKHTFNQECVLVTRTPIDMELV